MRVGFFDSGLGGLTVLKKVVANFGNHQYFYFGDTLRVPYGSKPIGYLAELLEKTLDFFEDLNIDILISACNTSDSLVKNRIVNVGNRNFRYISIIDNGIRQISANERVLLLATENTVKSGSYRDGLVEKGIGKLTEKSCPLFVPLIEEGFWYGQMAESIVRYYLEDSNSGFDKIILGCTHYPILKKHIIKNITAEIVDPADGIIKELGTSYNLKHSSGLPKINFYITGDVEKFKVLSGRFLRTVYFRGYYFKMDLETKKYYYFR
jgi:glutamate racemase